MLVSNASARALFALPEENVIGRPIMDLINHVGLVRMVSEPSSQDGVPRVEQDLPLANGHFYRARVTLVEGGSRFITLRRLS